MPLDFTRLSELSKKYEAVRLSLQSLESGLVLDESNNRIHVQGAQYYDVSRAIKVAITPTILKIIQAAATESLQKEADSLEAAMKTLGVATETPARPAADPDGKEVWLIAEKLAGGRFLSSSIKSSIKKVNVTMDTPRQHIVEALKQGLLLRFGSEAEANAAAKVLEHVYGEVRTWQFYTDDEDIPF